MKVRKIVKNTTNRGEFNRAYKEYLVSKSKIRCALCKYHDNENYEGNYYGGFKYLKYPNWKLVNKNHKQWEGKSLKIITDDNYTKIVF